MFILCGLIVVPKVTATAKMFDTKTAKGVSETTNSSSLNAELTSGYEPPNYGGPNSQHGSGTR